MKFSDKFILFVFFFVGGFSFGILFQEILGDNFIVEPIVAKELRLVDPPKEILQEFDSSKKIPSNSEKLKSFETPENSDLNSKISSKSPDVNSKTTSFNTNSRNLENSIISSATDLIPRNLQDAKITKFESNKTKKSQLQNNFSTNLQESPKKNEKVLKGKERKKKTNSAAKNYIIKKSKIKENIKKIELEIPQECEWFNKQLMLNFTNTGYIEITTETNKINDNTHSTNNFQNSNTIQNIPNQLFAKALNKILLRKQKRQEEANRLKVVLPSMNGVITSKALLKLKKFIENKLKQVENVNIVGNIYNKNYAMSYEDNHLSSSAKNNSKIVNKVYLQQNYTDNNVITDHNKKMAYGQNNNNYNESRFVNAVKSVISFYK